jgi:hypothetical protein
VEGSKALVRELLAEAEFYQVEGLIALLAPDDHDAASGGGAPPFAFAFSSSTPVRQFGGHVTHLAPLWAALSLSLSFFSPSLSSLSAACW